MPGDGRRRMPCVGGVDHAAEHDLTAVGLHGDVADVGTGNARFGEERHLRRGLQPHPMCRFASTPDHPAGPGWVAARSHSLGTMPAVVLIALAVLFTLTAPGVSMGAPRAVPTAEQYAACNRMATVRMETSPAPAPSSTPGGAPTTAPRSPTVVSPPGAPNAGPLLTDGELLEQADPRYRDDGVFRHVFLECLRRIGGG